MNNLFNVTAFLLFPVLELKQEQTIFLFAKTKLWFVFLSFFSHI